MSHELRTASIMGNAELLTERPRKSPAARCIRTIRQNCDHLLGLIDGFLVRPAPDEPSPAAPFLPSASPTS